VVASWEVCTECSERYAAVAGNMVSHGLDGGGLWEVLAVAKKKRSMCASRSLVRVEVFDKAGSERMLQW
jgi:hypothetical protein